jgi:hypothetical protein
MYKHVALFLGVLALFSPASAYADPITIGPVYPAPGGNSFAPAFGTPALKDSFSTGAQNPNFRQANYGGFDASAFEELYFGAAGLNSFCVAFDGSCSGSEYLSLTSISGSSAFFTGSFSFLDSATGQTETATSHLWLILRDSSNTDINWSTGAAVAAANPGSTAAVSNASILADVTTAAAGGGLILYSTLSVCGTDEICMSAADLFAAEHADNCVGGNCLVTSTSMAFYASETAAAVPEPASLLLLGTGCAAIARRVRRKSAKAQPFVVPERQ